MLIKNINFIVSLYFLVYSTDFCFCLSFEGKKLLDHHSFKKKKEEKRRNPTPRRL